MFRPLSLLGLCIIIVLVSACAGKPKGPVSLPVQGQVNLDGKPLVEGEVYFGLPGLPPSVLTVKDGTFSGKAREGMNKVEVRAYQVGPADPLDPTGAPTKVNYLPPRYNDQSDLTAEVKAGAANNFTLDVTSN